MPLKITILFSFVANSVRGFSQRYPDAHDVHYFHGGGCVHAARDVRRAHDYDCAHAHDARCVHEHDRAHDFHDVHSLPPCPLNQPISQRLSCPSAKR